MKKIIILVCLVACLFLAAGCYPKGEIQSSDDMTPIEGSNESADDASNTEPLENRTAEDNKALIEQLMKEKGLDATEDNEEETEKNESEETTEEGNYTIEIINMRGEPEKNLDIKAGDSVTWISRQQNYVHRIQLRLKLDNGGYGNYILEPSVSLKMNESFTYQFEEAGKFQWYSKTNYPTTSGYITVE